MIDVNRRRSASESASLLAIWGLLPRLQAACLMLASKPEHVVRSATLSMPVPEDTPTSLAQTVKLFAQEHFVEAEVDSRPGRLVVKLQRRVEGGAP
ncbi:MAG: hypothetical protein WD379_09815 [Dehalococcoidia bacterium]